MLGGRPSRVCCSHVDLEQYFSHPNSTKTMLLLEDTPVDAPTSPNLEIGKMESLIVFVYENFSKGYIVVIDMI